MPTYNDYKPRTRVKQAAFNSSGNIFNPPATGRDCVHNTVLVGKQIMGFFQHKLLQKLTQACLDAHTECTSLNHCVCCHNLVVSEGEARGCESQELAGVPAAAPTLPGLFLLGCSSPVGPQRGRPPPHMLRARVRARRLSTLEDWSSFLLKTKLPELPFF